MQRRTRTIARWAVTLVMLIGLFGAMPGVTGAQDTATIEADSQAATNEATVATVADEPIVSATLPPPPPPPAATDEPVVVATDEPVVVPTDEPPAPPATDEPVVDPTDEPPPPATDETAPDPTAAPTEPAPTGQPEATETPDFDATATPDGTPADPNARLAEIQATGSIVVTSVDSGGGSAPNACFVVFENNNGSQGQYVAQGCDSDDGSDGVTNIGGVPAGTFLLVSSFVPEGVVLGGQQSVTVVAGQATSARFVFAAGGRTLVIAKVDENGAALPGACFNVSEDVGGGQPGDFVSGNCSDPARTDGLVFVFGIAPGNYVLIETQAPAGYLSGQSRAFSVSSGSGDVNLTVANSPIDSPGNLIVNKVDENGQPLGGACFDAFVDEGGGDPGDFVGGRCDFSDGQNDGQTVIPGIPPGNYVLIESVAPPGYIVGGSRAFTISSNEVTVITMTNARGGATLTIRKVDENGDPLPDSCFNARRVFDSGRQDFVAGRCDNSGPGTNDGTVVIEGLLPGNYLLFESFVPDGYVRGADTAFTVNASADDVTLTIANARGGGGDGGGGDGDGDDGGGGETPVDSDPGSTPDRPAPPAKPAGSSASSSADAPAGGSSEGVVSGLPNTGAGESHRTDQEASFLGLAALASLMTLAALAILVAAWTVRRRPN